LTRIDLASLPPTGPYPKASESWYVLSNIGGVLPQAAFMLWRQGFASFVCSWRSHEGAPETLVDGLVLTEAQRCLSTHER
jgi:hypothetical protein